MTDLYLIWSHEHGAWWGPARCGYTMQLKAAGRYSREQAIDICKRAIPGDAHRTGVLQELPVRETDVQAMVREYDKARPDRQPEAWE